jgi:AcrR family transcriptional regulator
MSSDSLMARPVTIQTEHIVETARLLFLEHGYALSTSRIARALGISEGTIFKRFGTKEALFAASMGMPSTDFARLWPEQAGEATLERNLERIGHELVAHFRVVLPRIIMLRQTSRIDPLCMLSQSKTAPPVVLLDGVADYLRCETALGRFQAHAPRIAARMLVGALANFVFFEVLGFEVHDEEETERTIRGMVSLLVTGSGLS